MSFWKFIMGASAGGPQDPTKGQPRPESVWQRERREEQAARAAERAKHLQRESVVRAEADAAAPAYLARIEARETERVAAFGLTAARHGDFLMLDWTDEKGAHRHALNLTAVRDIQMTHGAPVSPDKGLVEFDGYTWQFRDTWSREYVGRRYYLYKDTVFGKGYPSRARPGRIAFVGTDFRIAIPHACVRAAHDSILDAITNKEPTE